MDWLNYHHLLYFWTVVREGGVSKASKVLRLAQPTVSGQIKALENAFGEKLFERQGRSLVLTDVGQVVFRYADEIFSLGRELQDTLKGRPVARPRRLVVGVSDSLEKRVAAWTSSSPTHRRPLRCGPTATCSASAVWGSSRGPRWRESSARDSRGRWTERRS